MKGNMHISRWMVLFSIGAVSALMIALYIDAVFFYDGEMWARILGLSIALPVVYFIGIRLIDFYLRDYWNHKKGLRSENTVCLELEKLPDEYHIFRNLRIDSWGDVDFVVVGPRGVFVLEVNSTKGEITEFGGRLLVNGREMSRNRLKQTLKNTLEVNSYLDGRYFVQGAAVFAHYKATLNLGFRKIAGVNVLKHQWVNRFIMEECDDQRLSEMDQDFIVKKLELCA